MNRHRMHAEPYLPPSADQVFRLLASPALGLLALFCAMVLYGNWGSALLQEGDATVDVRVDARVEATQSAANRNTDDINRRMQVKDLARVLAL